jgi:hypothetical protein
LIAFGCSITRPGVYRSCAERGIRLASEPGTQVLARPAVGSIFEGYNQILDEAAGLVGLEALVLLHQDAEIADPGFCSKLRDALRDPRVGVVGCAGAVGVRSIAWASFLHRVPELGGGVSASYTWDEKAAPPYCQLGEVDTVDGVLLALSPWVVRNVRFDESLGQVLHGYDFDFCLQVRAAGRKIATADFKVIHHHPIRVTDQEPWTRAHVAIAEKWDGKMPGVGVAPGSWRQRARQAEAEAAVIRARAAAKELEIEARAAEYEDQLSLMTNSIGWRLTAPVRRANGIGRAWRGLSIGPGRGSRG